MQAVSREQVYPAHTKQIMEAEMGLIDLASRIRIEGVNLVREPTITTSRTPERLGYLGTTVTPKRSINTTTDELHIADGRS